MAAAVVGCLILTFQPGCESLPGAGDEQGFVSLFDGRTLKGWTQLGGTGYAVTNVVEQGATNAVIRCIKGAGGNLLSNEAYQDFILRFEFRLEAGSNNGLGIRCPSTATNLHQLGIELQILDDSAPKYATLKPYQFHGSLYGVAPAERGALKPVGHWNTQEVSVRGRQVTVVLNGTRILHTNINAITDAATLRAHPGLLRESGHIGFLGHGDPVDFRHIRIRELPRPILNNSAPDGFQPLFNGKDLTGWKGLMAAPNDNPVKRAQLAPAQRQQAQAKADVRMREHWAAKDGALEFDGKGDSLATADDYRDFEMLVDWKILEAGDSGIYLRGTPQVQIWDPRSGNDGAKVGSGGLYNTQKGPSKPLVVADQAGWNQFRILMVGDRVHVFLNGRLVVRDVALENYWDRALPLFESGQIELQNHGNKLWFRNLYIREIRTTAAP